VLLIVGAASKTADSSAESVKNSEIAASGKIGSETTVFRFIPSAVA
jgi:hypothetical protein